MQGSEQSVKNDLTMLNASRMIIDNLGITFIILMLTAIHVDAQLEEQFNKAPLTDVQQWVDKNALELNTVKPLMGLGDLEPIREIVGDARIVGLGESTHGSREFFQLRHRILEFLVQEMHFNVFAIEASLPEAMDVNRYVMYGEEDPQRASGRDVFLDM